MNTFLGNKRNSASNKPFEYYCSLCGDEVLTSSILIDEFPRRKTDESFICIEGKVTIETFMKKGRLLIIRRGSNKYEKQYTYVCKSCTIIVAYQSNEFEDEKNDNSDLNQENIIYSKKQKKIIYILADSLVTSPEQSSLSIEIEKIKENQNKKSTINYLRIKKKY